MPRIQPFLQGPLSSFSGRMLFRKEDLVTRCGHFLWGVIASEPIFELIEVGKLHAYSLSLSHTHLLCLYVCLEP